MASFVVMEAPEGRDEAVYVRDGFHVLAFLLPPIWLAWHRLWIEALLAFAVMAVLGSLGGVSGFGDAAPLLSLLVSLYVGLEAPAIWIAALAPVALVMTISGFAMVPPPGPPSSGGRRRSSASAPSSDRATPDARPCFASPPRSSAVSATGMS